MSNVIVVTDSTAYIPASALKGLNIPVIPLWLLWDDDRYRDGVDIDHETFYRRLKGSKSLPTTSQPSAGEFEAFFRQAAPEGQSIVSVLISSKLSGTVASAQAAQIHMPSSDIRVVDSLSVSMGQGFIAVAAAQAATAGASADEVVAVAEAMRDRIHLMFGVDTLEFLHRRGRIGGAKRLLGTALNIKPILYFVDGQIEPLSQARTKRKALDQMVTIAEQRLAGKPMAEAAIVDVDSPEEGDRVAEQIRQHFGLDIVHRSSVSPVVGATSGPGAIGFAFYGAL